MGKIKNIEINLFGGTATFFIRFRSFDEDKRFQIDRRTNTKW